LPPLSCCRRLIYHSEKEKAVPAKRLDNIDESKVRIAISSSLSHILKLRSFVPPIHRFPPLKDITPFVTNVILQYIFPQDHWLKELTTLWSSERRDTLALELPATDFKSTLFLVVCFHLSTTVTGCAMVPGGFEARGLAAGLVTVGLGIQMGVLGFWWYWTEQFRLAVIIMVLLALLRVLTVVGFVLALWYAIFHEKDEDREKED
jgi:hypothetical protein